MGKLVRMRKWIHLLVAIGVAFVVGVFLYQTEELGDVWTSISSLWAGLQGLPEISIPMPKWPFG